MRHYLDLFESLEKADEIITDLADRWDNYDAGDVWTFGRSKLEDEIIAYARTIKQSPVTGDLYRGQGVFDDDFERLMNGETVTIPLVKTKLTSWTKDADIADRFAETSMQCHGFSSISFRYPASKLTPVLDFTQFPPLDGSLTHIVQNEREVICLHCELTISPDMVFTSHRYEGDK